MPTSNFKLNPNWVELPASAQVGQAHFRVPPDQRNKLWIVVAFEDGNYAVFRYAEFVNAVQNFSGQEMASGDLFDIPLTALSTFLDALKRAPVELEQTDLKAIAKNLDELSNPPRVARRAGAIEGIIAQTTRGGSAENLDWFDRIRTASANGGGGQHAEPPPMAAPPGTLPATAEPSQPPPRKINIRFEPPEQKDQPLQVGETYTLVFSVDLEQLATAIAAANLEETGLFPPNVDEIDLYVQLLSEDFDVLTDPQKLIVPRAGKSKNRARFDISPKHNGASELTAVFTKDGNAVQAITLKLNVGVTGEAAILKTETLGRTIEAAGGVKPRAISMWIDYVGAGFKFSFLGPDGGASFTLPLQLQELEQLINDARAALQEIVEWKDKNNFVYQVGITVPPAVSQKTLPRLAEAGYLLFQTIFMHPGAPQSAKDFGKKLRDLAQRESLNIQITSKEMMLPWGILYVADRFDPNDIKPEYFLGLKHIIEHNPLQPGMDFPPSIGSKPELAVSLNVNKEIDTQMGFPLIANQLKYWDGIKAKGGIRLITRSSSADLINALADDKTPDEIAYFYVHAASKSLAEGGAKAATLGFGANQVVTLKDFLLRAPSEIRLANAPLVFINACESAELSPLFYNGFMPYFVDKGARGMIGTECPVPALFAADWAQNFFDQFLKGKPLGQTFLDLRRAYFYNHNNILGLLYAVYADADTQVAPPIG